MALTAYLDATGIHVPTYDEILEDLKERYRGIYGADLYLEADSQEGQMLAMFALDKSDVYQLAVSVYNAFSPHTAQGAGLSRMVKINGLARLAASYSTADVLLTGAPGTIITSGVASDVAGQKWTLPETVVLPASGEITVTATAQDAGDVRAAAGEISTIATPTRGWVSVTNPAAAVAGAPVESDAVLRKRQAVSTALPSSSVLEGIEGAVANLAGVTRHMGYENDEDTTDANGLPPHSICLVVEGGDDTAIAQAIAIKKTPGTPTYGGTAVTVTDRYGMPNVIRFARAVAVPPALIVVLQARAGYVSTTGDAIKANVAAYLNEHAIGEDVLLSKLYSPINAAEPDTARKTFDILSLTIGRTADSLAAANLELAFNEVAAGDVANISLTVES